MTKLTSLTFVLLLSACAGGTPAKNPDGDPPPFDDPKGNSPPTAPASSAKVKDGMDAIAAGDFAKAGPNVRHRSHQPKLPPELIKAGELVRKRLASDQIALRLLRRVHLKFRLTLKASFALNPMHM